jgi:hypothetical protein
MLGLFAAIVLLAVLDLGSPLEMFRTPPDPTILRLVWPRPFIMLRLDGRSLFRRPHAPPHTLSLAWPREVQTGLLTVKASRHDIVRLRGLQLVVEVSYLMLLFAVCYLCVPLVDVSTCPAHPDIC